MYHLFDDVLVSVLGFILYILLLRVLYLETYEFVRTGMHVLFEELYIFFMYFSSLLFALISL